MKRILSLSIAALLFVASPVAAGNRPNGELLLFSRLNGVPVALGVLTTAGTTISNTTTAAPFTLVGGSVIRVVCDAAAFVRVGTTASSDYTSAVFGEPMAVGAVRFFVLQMSDTAIAVDTTGGAANCNVAVMN
jgi:hypothetical protein